MTSPRPTDDALVAAVRELLIEIGVAMSEAGDSVDAIDSSLRAMIAAYGVEHVEVAVLPTSLMVGTGQGTGTQVEIGIPRRTPLRFDQIAELYTLVRAASSAALSPHEALEQLDAIYRMPPTFHWPVRTLGHAVMTVGLALLLQPTVGAVGAAFVLGLLVGLAKLPRLATLQLVFPVVVSFVVSVIVFATLQQLQIDNPVRILIPPLVTFLPGAALTIATVELAAGQMVSGASRLVSGLVQLLLLAFGILAASALFDLSAAVLADNPVNRLGWWAPWLGVVVFAVGIYLHLSAPARALPWMLVIMLAAYAGQVAGAAAFGGLLSGFFGALAMTPLALWVETVRNGPPKLVTFLPGFWLLVPGAAGLIGVTELLGVDHQLGAQAVVDSMVTVMSIALGVLIGTAAYHTTDSGLRALSVDRNERHGDGGARRPYHPTQGGALLPARSIRSASRPVDRRGGGGAMTNAAANDTAPAPTLNVRQAAFIGVGAMVGAGIFALLGSAGEVAGAAVWISFLIAGAVAGLQGYSFAKFGARYPSVGGLLEYVVRGFGNGHATGVIAWLILAANAIVTGMVAVSFGSYASSAVADGSESWAKVFAVAVVLVMATLNVLGSQAVARAQTVVVVIVTGILTVFAVATLANLDTDLLAFSGYPGLADIVSSVALTFFAFLGFGVVTFTAKDLADPARQLPRALYLALGIATVIYVAVALGVFGTLTVDEVIDSGGTALAVAAEPVLGRAGYWMMTVTALFATAGATNSGLYPAAGLCEQMTSIGQFPPVLGRRLGGRLPTGLLVTAVIAMVLAVGFDLSSIASIGSVIALVVFALVTAGHVRVRAETGANLLVLLVALSSCVIVLVTFVFTTLVDEPATAVLLAVILLLSVGLDLGWKRVRVGRVPAGPTHAVDG